MKNQPTHLGISEKFLVVEYWQHIGSAQRRQQVKVPIEWLLADEVLDALDKAMRRRMIDRWSDTAEIEPALF